VKVFALTGHPSGATRAYAWSYRTEGTRRKFLMREVRQRRERAASNVLPIQAKRP
jgi:hypothetical protein